MGYSPSDILLPNGSAVHFELKDGGRIILWDDEERNKILDLDKNTAELVLADLELLIKLS